MPKKRTPEFKREVACLVLDQGYSHIAAARSHGGGGPVSMGKRLHEERVGVTLQSKALTSEQQKIQVLEARID